MSDYRHGSHTTFSIHLHIVWIIKYRHKVLRGEVAERVRAIVREECQKARVDILQGHIAPDHVHVMISIAYSTPKLPLIPGQTCHAFHTKVASNSTAKLPPPGRGLEPTATRSITHRYPAPFSYDEGGADACTEVSHASSERSTPSEMVWRSQRPENCPQPRH